MDELLGPWGWDETWAERFRRHADEGLVPGRVSVEHRGLYHFHGPHGEGVARVGGRLRHLAFERADFPAVGDWVALRLPTDPGPAVIEAVLPRTNKLSRTAAGDAGGEQILAANLDVLFLVTSLNRDLNPRRLERSLAAAALPECRPVLVLTKSDLCERPAEVVGDLRTRLGADVAVHAVCAPSGDGLDELARYLLGRRTVALLGSSGVGKSTLLNRLASRDVQEVQPVREEDDRGRHTTTHRELVAPPQGGLLIDSPGLRELRLWADGSDVGAAFEDVESLAARCPFADCSHTHEPRCAVRQGIADGLLDPDRLENFLKLQKELEYERCRADPRAARERKERDHRLHRSIAKQQRRRKES
jgi:ribosome biogenesis GTPase / thiamine phosphate phosphatase